MVKTESKTQEIIIAGFGGQGVLFAGKVLAYAGMMAGNEVAWCPSYGPEMRGGTANCSISISEEPIGSPIINHPSILIAMNKPSFEKFEQSVAPGGMILVDGSLIDSKTNRTDVTFISIPSSGIANDIGVGFLSNMVLLGQLMKLTDMFTLKELEKALIKNISARKKDLFEANIKAIQAGYDTVTE